MFANNAIPDMRTACVPENVGERCGEIYLFIRAASKHACCEQRHCVKFIANREAPERVLI
jgi:hypothetical protein